MSPRRRVVAVVDDLMVRSRIEAAAPAEIELSFPRQRSELLRLLDLPPDLMVVGLAATRQPWPEWIRAARAHPTAVAVPILAFGPHKDLALRQRALEAGADRVLANSAFMQALPRLLGGEVPAADDSD